MKYVGLTDDPARRREEHNNPRDWKQRTFSTEEEARKWAKELDCRLIKDLWAFREIGSWSDFAYEWHDEVEDRAMSERVFSPTDLHP